MDSRYSVLIYRLPEAFLNDAVKSILEVTTISENSISLMKPDHWGAKLILDNERNFREVLSLCSLSIHNNTYYLHSLVTDLIVCGTGVQIDALKVKDLLERYAPVFSTYEIKKQHGGKTFRATLNYPEISEIVQLWTGSNLKMSGYDGIEFKISPFCRFCHENGHFKSQCRRRQLPVFEKDSSISSPLPNNKIADRQVITASSNSSGSANSAKRSSDRSLCSSDSKMVSDRATESKQHMYERGEDQGPVFKNVTLRSPPLPDCKVANGQKIASLSENNGSSNFVKKSPDRSVCSSDSRVVSGEAIDSKRSKKAALVTTPVKPQSSPKNLIYLIPPTMRKDVKTLKLFFSDCKNFKNLYEKALHFPAGIESLLRQLRKIVKFNKNVMSKSEEEMAFLSWICLLLAKLQYFHLKKNVRLEPFYEPYLLDTEEVKSEKSD